MAKTRKTCLCVAIIAALMLLIAAAFTASPVFADDKVEPDWNSSVFVSVNLTMYDEFVKSGGTSFALAGITVPYFDLANYGLEDYYYNPDCYSGGGQAPGTAETARGKVTMLHLFIYMTEIYRCNVPANEAGLGWLAEHDWRDLTFSGSVGSIFFSPTFWDYTDGNLNYWLNYEYPFGSPGWGSTADQILLSDGDVVSVKNTPWGEDDMGSFYHFGESGLYSQEIYENEDITVSLYEACLDNVWTPTDTAHESVGEGFTVSVVSTIGGTALVSDITDSNGEVTLDTSDLDPGVYYIVSDTFAPAAMYLIINAGQDPAVELAAAKTAAKAELAGYADPSLYRDAQKAELSAAISSGNSAIDAATSTSGVSSALAAAKAAIDNIKTDAQLIAEELAAAKTAAKSDLESYKSESLYRDEQKQELKAAINRGKASIDAAATIEEVNNALKNAKNEIDKIKTDAELSENLDAFKNQAKNALDTYVSPSLYRDAQKAELSEAIKNGKAAIDKANSIEDAVAAFTAAKAEIDKIKTDEELKKEEEAAAEALVEAKTTAKADLAGYKDASLYRDAEKEELSAAIARGIAAIDDAKTAEEVAAAIKAVKAEIDKIKTDAEYKEEEAQGALTSAAIEAAKAAKPKVSAKALKKGKAKITWKKVTLEYSAEGIEKSRAVSGYRIYRATKKNGKYKLIKTIKKGKTVKFTDSKLKKGKKYFYKVRTFTTIDGTSYNGKLSKAVKVKAK